MSLVDSVIGEYKLKELIGEGASAEVWKAINDSGEVVAVKIYSPEIRITKKLKAKIKSLFESQKDFKHENILSPISYHEINGNPAIVFKLMSSNLGEEYEKRRKQTIKVDSGIFTQREIASVLICAAQGLKYLHANGISHNDIKPANILIDHTTLGLHAVLCDLDTISKNVIKDDEINLREEIFKLTTLDSRANEFFTPFYAPPEKNNKLRSKFKGDIFSLGASIIEITSVDKLQEPISSILYRNPEFGIVGFPVFPMRLQNLINSMIDVDPNKRPFLDDIISWCSHYLQNNSWPEDLDDLKRETKPTQEVEVNSGQQVIGDPIIITQASKSRKFFPMILASLLGLAVVGYFVIGKDAKDMTPSEVNWVNTNSGQMQLFVDGNQTSVTADEVLDWYGSYACIRIGDKCGVVDKTGKMIKKNIYNTCSYVVDKESIELKLKTNSELFKIK